MRYLTTYKIFESTDDVVDNLEDIFMPTTAPPRVAFASILEEPTHSLGVSINKCNPKKYLSSYHTQLHNRADYKILIGIEVDKDSEDADFLTSHIDDDLVESVERSIDYMDSIGYDYKIGYGWDGDTYTDGGVDMEDDMENIYDYEILADTFIGVYFFKRENISESNLIDGEGEEVQETIRDLLIELEDKQFKVDVTDIGLLKVSRSFEVSIMKNWATRTGYKTDSLFPWSEVKEDIVRVYDYLQTLDKNITVRMWMDSVEVASGWKKSEQFTIPDGSTQWKIRLLISI